MSEIVAKAGLTTKSVPFRHSIFLSLGLRKYDAAGNRISVTDARGNVTRQVYDGLNRLIRTEQLGATPVAVTTYTYDAVGNLTTVTDPENTKCEDCVLSLIVCNYVLPIKVPLPWTPPILPHPEPKN